MQQNHYSFCACVCLSVSLCAYVCHNYPKKRFEVQISPAKSIQVQRRYKYVPNNAKHNKINNNFVLIKKPYLQGLVLVTNMFFECLFCCSYFPIQNFENIFSNKSSVVISPVISPKWNSDCRMSAANKSPESSFDKPL